MKETDEISILPFEIKKFVNISAMIISAIIPPNNIELSI